MISAAHGGRHPRGQSLVEFALALPLIIILLVGVFDFGRAIFASSTINNAAREGARLAIVDQTESHIRDLAAQRAETLGVVPASIGIEYFSATALDDPCPPAALGTPAIVGCVAVVTVPYTYTAAIPLIGDLVGEIDMTGEARFPVAFNCVDPPPDPPISCPLGN